MCVSQLYKEATLPHNGSKQRAISAPCSVKPFTAQITCKKQNAETNAEVNAQQSLIDSNELQFGHPAPPRCSLPPIGYLLTLQKSERVRDGRLMVYVCL